jgi:preprotein translocase subunit YajC
MSLPGSLQQIRVINSRFQNLTTKGEKMNNTFILAQTDANQKPSDIISGPVSVQGTTTKTVTPDPNTSTKASQKKGFFGDYGNLLVLALMFIVMYLLVFRAPRKKQQEHKQMVQSLQKNDRVRTIGGIIGTVVDIKEDEITLKVDESTNTKIKVVASAIGKKLSKDNN